MSKDDWMLAFIEEIRQLCEKYRVEAKVGAFSSERRGTACIKSLERNWKHLVRAGEWEMDEEVTLHIAIVPEDREAT